MRTRDILYALAALALTAQAPLFAATPATEGYEAMRGYASCIVGRNRSIASGLLAIEPDSGREKQAARTIERQMESCLTAANAMESGPLLLRGAIAEALYRVDFGISGPGSAAVPGAQYYPGAPEPDVYPSTRARNQALYAFAGCVATAQPAKAHALVVSNFGSAPERRAFADLTPAFAPCFPKGGTATFNQISLRALLAESLYRMASAPKLAGS